MTTTEAPPDETVVHVLWINAGLSCDGDSVALTAATQPSIEEIALGALPGLPKIAVHWPLIDFECGPVGGADDFIEWFFKAERGEPSRSCSVEGSIPNEAIKREGYWCGFGNNPDTDQPMTTSEWLDRLAEGACDHRGEPARLRRDPRHGRQPDRRGGARLPRWGGSRRRGSHRVHPTPAHPTTCRRRSSTSCTRRRSAPMIPLGKRCARRLFGATVHEGCDRAAPRAGRLHRVWLAEVHREAAAGGPVVGNAKRGWMNGLGGCPNVGGICIGCTMPGFPDKFMPFMDEPPGARVSTMASGVYGSAIRGLRRITAKTIDEEPKWRTSGSKLLTGYKSEWR